MALRRTLLLGANLSGARIAGALLDRTIMTGAILNGIEATGAHGSLLAAQGTAAEDDDSLSQLRAAGAEPIEFAQPRA